MKLVLTDDDGVEHVFVPVVDVKEEEPPVDMSYVAEPPADAPAAI